MWGWRVVVRPRGARIVVMGRERLFSRSKHLSSSLPPFTHLLGRQVDLGARLQRAHVPPRCAAPAQHVNVQKAHERFLERACIQPPLLQAGFESHRLGRQDGVLLGLGLALADGAHQRVELARVCALHALDHARQLHWDAVWGEYGWMREACACFETPRRRRGSARLRFVNGADPHFHPVFFLSLAEQMRVAPPLHAAPTGGAPPPRATPARVNGAPSPLPGAPGARTPAAANERRRLFNDIAPVYDDVSVW